MTVTFVEQREIPIGELHPHPENPNRGSVKDLMVSLEEFGQYRSVVALKDGTILAGHHVVEAAKKLNLPSVRVDVVDANEQEARKILLADNRLADLGLGPDLDLLLESLQKVEGLTGTGFDTEYIQMLEEATAGAPPLEDLEDEIGPPSPNEFYRRLTLTLDPKLVTRWEEWRKDYEDDTEAFRILLDGDDGAGFGDPDGEDDAAASA